jgi:hypothetical protein
MITTLSRSHAQAQAHTILDRDYPPSKVNRADATKFAPLPRSSIHLSRGLYRTEAEQQSTHV